MDAEERAHRAAVASALQANEDIGRLTGRLGTAEHPRGAVLVAYRNARRGLRGALGTAGPYTSPVWAVREVMTGLEQDVAETMRSVAARAVAAGLAMADEQLGGYGLAGFVPPMALSSEQAEAVTAVTGLVVAQTKTAAALAATGTDPEMIYGNERQAGIVQPGPVVSAGALWIGTLVAGAFGWLVGQRSRGAGEQAWWHQVVAAIDERTTDCCLRANGQSQPLDKPFRLTGTPRFADMLAHPPFHWFCRTSEALVRPQDAQDAVTQQLIAAGLAELRARAATGTRVEIHPAHARSRRSGS
jgi:hypothetical protein